MAADLKDKLRRLIRAGRDKEASDLLPLVDDAPPVDRGRWTAKDNLAHLTAWRLSAAAELAAARTGDVSSVPTADVNEFNARTYEEMRDKPAASVLDDGLRSWNSLLAALEACTEEELAKPRVRRPEQPAWMVIPGNTYFHVAEHLGYWYTEHDDQAAAEAVAKWAHGLAVQSFPDDRSRGIADYNLGCFYAVRGRAEDALPYLQNAIELNPSLEEWARSDTDLDPIRSVPGVVRLLGA
jgi:tetratricopeptide (TPR) repeat protein